MGTRQWSWVSDPFGTTPADSDPDSDGQHVHYNPRFPGQYYDSETDLHYNYFRDYDPATGRYIQSDPIGLTGGLNTYSYVDSNPLFNIDLRGLAWSNARAIWHFYTGGGRTVTLGEIGHYNTVTSVISPIRKQWEKKVAQTAKNKAYSISCNSSVRWRMNEVVAPHSGVFWIGSFDLSKNASCSVLKTCKISASCQSSNSTRKFKFYCTLDYYMHDLFENPSDFDNSYGTPDEDFWDDWEYGGTPFYVDGYWQSLFSGGGTL